MPSTDDAGPTAARRLTNVARAICYVAVALILLLPLPILYEVIADQLGEPPTWVFETTGYIIILIAFLAAGYGLGTGHHFKVDLLARSFPRLAAPLDILRALAEMSFGVILFVAGSMQTHDAWQQDMRSDTLLAVPLFWPMLAFPIGGLGIFVQGVANLFGPSVENARQ